MMTSVSALSTPQSIPTFRVCDNAEQDGDDDPFEVMLFEWQVDPFEFTSTVFIEVGRFNLADNEILEIFVLPVDLGGGDTHNSRGETMSLCQTACLVTRLCRA